MRIPTGPRLDGDGQAFSILDLVACVALLFVFGLMFLPAVLVGAREKAHVAVCLNNVKQHGIAQSILFEDGGVRYEDWPRLWIQQLQKARAELLDARFCPVAPERSANRLNPPSPGGLLNQAWLVSSGPVSNQGSYGMNGYFYVDDPYSAGGMRHFRTPDQVVFPSTTPVFADSVWTEFWPTPEDRPARNLVTADNFTSGGLSRIAIPRHGAKISPSFRNFDSSTPLPGAVNLVFSDNHAETVKLEHLWNLQWHREWVAPAKRPGLP
jgi:hypothetical protein